MKKRLFCVFALLLAAVLLTACGEKTVAPIPAVSSTQVNVIENVINPPEDVQYPDYPEGYDPASEEDYDTAYMSGAYDEYGNMVQIGATAIPLDPIDMPTPTPRPALAFNYARKDFALVGLSFECPQDWVDEENNGSVTLCDTRTRDGYRARVEVIVEGAPSSMKKTDLKPKLDGRLEALHYEESCSEWSVSAATERKLMGKDGYYATFHGYTNGVEIRGRVHLALCDGKVITVIYVCPAAYVNDYYTVYDKLRSTLKVI
ncbi:MAG: hypothetical protein CW338_07730 [Clostridiales bacterium]|nr:hypothetical protein [Clostridiales bacterium]